MQNAEQSDDGDQARSERGEETLCRAERRTRSRKQQGLDELQKLNMRKWNRVSDVLRRNKARAAR